MSISRVWKWLLVLLSVLGAAAAMAYEETTSNGSFVVTRLNNGQPIITEAMFQTLGASEVEGQGINGPSLIRIPDWIPAAKRADPAAVYYLYFAHHHDKYIRMAWAADIAGPWTLYDVGSGIALGDRGVLDLGDKTMPIGNGIVIPNNHLASPDAHVDDENQKIILYFHSGSKTEVDGKNIQGQKSYAATSDYGLEFAGKVEPVVLGVSYFSVFKYDGNYYALDNGATLYKARNTDNPWAPPADWDFRNELWLRATNNPYQEAIGRDGYEFSELRVRHTSTLVEGDTLYTFYSRRGANPPERIMMSVTDLGASKNHTEWVPSHPPEEIYRPQPGWEGGQFELRPSRSGRARENLNEIRDPYIFKDTDGELYVIYTAAGEDALGILHLERK